MARILVVDDEPDIRRIIRAYVERSGHIVTETGRGQCALDDVFSSSPPDLVLLDIGLPDIDGLEVLRRIRESSRVHVLMVTARTDEVDELVGLGMGADDYIRKPFSGRQVAARVDAVLRRREMDKASAGSGVMVGADGLCVDPSRHEVRVDGRAVSLTALQFEVLAALVAARGRVLTRRHLLERVWGWDGAADDRVVDVHIRAIRHALDDDAMMPRFIETVRGVGYRALEAQTQPGVDHR